MKRINLFLSQIFDWRRFNKHIALHNYKKTEDKHIRKQYKNNKVKIIAPTWNDEFELPDGSYSVSEIQDDIIKKNITSTAIPPFDGYIAKIMD